jgi:hypothetical protein
MTTPTVRFRTLASALLLPAALGACRERKEEEGLKIRIDTGAAVAPPAAAPSPSFSTDTAGGVAIRTTDGNVEMALRNDRVQVGLSEKVLSEVRQKMATDSSGQPSGSLGGMIKGIVGNAVQGALATRLEYPVDEIEDISYDGERMHLVVRGKGPQIEHMDVNKRPVMESFAPDDARRFVEAVRAAKAGRTGAPAR